jgi:hypothetical protein
MKARTKIAIRRWIDELGLALDRKKHLKDLRSFRQVANSLRRKDPTLSKNYYEFARHYNSSYSPKRHRITNVNQTFNTFWGTDT